MTCVIDSSSSVMGEPLPEVTGQPIRPPNERTRNSKMGLEVSRDNQKVYGEKSLVQIG